MPQMSWLARQDGYDPNAFDVPGEQGTNVGWANRMGEILTTRPTYDEQTVLHSTASPLVNITEGDIGRATEAAMGVSGGGMSVSDIAAKYPKLKIDISNPRSPNDYGVLSRLEVPKEMRGQGLATQAMQDIIAEADKTKAKLALSPSGDWGASVPRLKEFYERFGFIPNAGRNKDFATRETMIRSPVMGSLAEGGGGGGGIRAYHSSPHDFDKFDLAKIGTGEGAQVYGHGLYFAESPAVSGQGGQYWNQFVQHIPRGPERDAAQLLQKHKLDRSAAIAEAEDVVRQYDDKHSRDMVALLKSNKIVGPRTYEVNINADPAHMLDWDKPLREQQNIADIIRSNPRSMDEMKGPIKRKAESVYSGDIPSDISGSDAYTLMHGYREPARASAALREAGIPGIKYLDQGSRAQVPTYRINKTDADNARYMLSRTDHMARDTSNKGFMTYAEAQAAQAAAEAADAARRTSNYVVFDPNIIDIMKKYAVPGAIGAGGMGALAAQNQYEEVY